MEMKDGMIRVVYKEENLILPVENNTLSLQCLKEYFPSANGLVYTDNEGVHGLLIKEGQIIINPNISTYIVRLAAGQEIPSNQNVKVADQSKLDRIHFYRKIIEGKNDSTDVPSIFSKNKVSQGTEKKSKISDLRKVAKPPSEPKVKFINIGWKHKSQRKFIKKKNLTNGSSRELELDVTRIFSIEDIIQMGIKQFDDDRVAKFTLANSTVRLGLFNGSMIENFNLPDDTEGGLWDYINYKNINGRVNFYLYSTPNKNFPEKVLHQLYDEEKGEESEEEKEQEKKQESEEEKEQEKGQENEDEDVLIRERKILADITNDPSIKVVAVPDKYKESNITNSKSNSSDLLDTSALSPLDSCPTIESFDEVQHHSFTVPVPPDTLRDLKIIERCLRRVDVSYAVSTSSKYTDEQSIRHESKATLFMASNEDEFHRIGEDQFDPVDYGYDISKIFINGRNILSMGYKPVTTGVMYRDYEFPTLEQKTPHSIAYDIDEMVGFYDEYLEIGVIPTCLSECLPVFTWYCNNEIYKRMSMAFWLQISRSNEDMVWHCQITCNHKQNLHSKRIMILSSILESSVVCEVKKCKFVMRRVIGAGSTAIIYEGTFSNTKVTVKTMKVYPRYKKLVEREIAVLKQIKHPNLIQMMAYCKEEKHVYLIMEYFECTNLQELIFDDSLKEEYEFDMMRKDSSCLQLSGVIKYLHELPNPIIHKDIKSENVLINKTGAIKLCDFGLSKFSIMITALKSTCNSKITGTKMYMAPEILLHKKDATEKSDVWSLGCTVLEIYKEDVTWDVQSEEELMKKLKNCEVPNLEKIPTYYQSIIERCFSYASENRPQIAEVYAVMNDAFMQSINVALNIVN